MGNEFLKSSVAYNAQPVVGFENCRLVSCRKLNFRQEACLRLSPNLDIDGDSAVDDVAAVVVDAVVVTP